MQQQLRLAPKSSEHNVSDLVAILTSAFRRGGNAVERRQGARCRLAAPQLNYTTAARSFSQSSNLGGPLAMCRMALSIRRLTTHWNVRQRSAISV